MSVREKRARETHKDNWPENKKETKRPWAIKSCIVFLTISPDRIIVLYDVGPHRRRSPRICVHNKTFRKVYSLYTLYIYIINLYIYIVYTILRSSPYNIIISPTIFLST